jgi:hypothetical protein
MTAFSPVNAVNKAMASNLFSLDIYGPFDYIRLSGKLLQKKGENEVAQLGNK